MVPGAPDHAGDARVYHHGNLREALVQVGPVTSAGGVTPGDVHHGPPRCRAGAALPDTREQVGLYLTAFNAWATGALLTMVSLQSAG